MHTTGCAPCYSNSSTLRATPDLNTFSLSRCRKRPLSPATLTSFTSIHALVCVTSHTAMPACPPQQLSGEVSVRGETRLVRQPVRCTTSPIPDFRTRQCVRSTQQPGQVRQHLRVVRTTVASHTSRQLIGGRCVSAHRSTRHDAGTLAVAPPGLSRTTYAHSASHPRSAGVGVSSARSS